MNRLVALQALSTIAHALKRPLGSVLACSDAALSTLREPSAQPEILRHALKGAAQQAQRAGRTLHELLVFLNQFDAKAKALGLNEIVRVPVVIEQDGFLERRPTVNLEQGRTPLAVKPPAFAKGARQFSQQFDRGDPRRSPTGGHDHHFGALRRFGGLCAGHRA